MVLTPVQARIDVMVNGTANLDRLANTYGQLERSATRATTAVQNWNRRQTGLVGGMTGMLGSLNNLSRNMASHANQVQQANRATGSWGGSILRLTKSMILFSVLLPLVRLPQTVIQSFQQFVQVGVEWEHQVRGVASLMGAQQNQYGQLDNSLRQLKSTYALTNEEVGVTVKQIATTLDVFQRSQQGMTAAQKAQDDLNSTLKVTEAVAKLSRAAFSDLGSTQQAVFTIVSTGRLTLDQLDWATNELFKTVQVGRTTFDQFNSAAQRFMPFWEEWVQATTNADDKLKRLTSTMDVYNAASLGLGPQRAATGVGQLAQSLTKMSGTQTQIIAHMEVIRRQQGLGEAFNITPQALYNLNSQVEVFERLQNVLGETSPLVDNYVQSLERLGRVNAADPAAVMAARAEGARQLQQEFFGSKTAVAAFTEVTSPGRLAQVTGERATATGVDAAYQYWLKDPKGAADRMKSAYEVIQTDLFDAMQKDFVSINVGVGNLFEKISKGLEAGLGGTSVFTRLQYVGEEIIRAFTAWYNGSGKAQIIKFGHNLGTFLAETLTAFFTGVDGQNAVADAGLQFARAFSGAVAEKLPALLSAAIQSSLGQLALTYMLFRTGGAGKFTAGAAAAGTTGLLQSGALPGQLAGLAIGAFGAATAARALWNRPLRYTGTGTNRAPVPGSTLGEIFGTTRASLSGAALHRNVQASYAGPEYITGAELQTQGIRRYRGRFINPNEVFDYRSGAPVRIGAGEINPDVVQQRQLRTQATSPAGRNRQLGAGLATAAVLGGIGLIQAMSEAPGQRSAAMGGTVGSILGGLLGGALGMIPAVATAGLATPVAIGGGLGGSLLGGRVGEWAGSKLSPWLEPLLSGGAAPATQNAAEQADQQQTVAQAVAEGIDSSETGANIAQLNRKAIPGTGMGGIAVRPTTTTATGAVAGTGQGATFVDQHAPNSTLTPAQADAACGPAAAAFFASAYGRQPTLAEAYALQSKLQGGDIAGLDGSNINTLGTAINQLAGGNVAEVGTGVDWGRLAENAKKGIPGIVNIGPKGNFPGHFLQIGGWNPATNQFNVGPSGARALRGGSEWMTPEQMMAYGPAIGAIYGIGPTGTAGTPGTGTGGYEDVARAAATKWGIDPDIYARQIRQESGFNPNAKSGAGAMGIAQFMKGTFGAGVSWDPYDPNVALDKSAQYMSQLSKQYGGMRNALWAYNAGEGNFQRGNMPDETKAYLNTILGGTGTGMGGPMGGINISGPLIGTVVLGAGSTEEQANELATILADLLDESHLTAGSTIGQTRLLTP